MPRASSVRHPAPVPPALRALARQALQLADDALAAECEEAFFVGGGPGGQHRNKTATGVRLRHPPTGVVVVATERRSQLRNREVALARLRARLEAMSAEPAVRRPTRPSRAARQRRLDDKRHASRTKARRGGRLE